MANEYAVNRADLVSVADAIRSKGETTGQLVFPSGFVTAIHDISTGVALNFQVVGGTAAPANPTENTIWVNTDQTITSWVFSHNQPANPSEGMVWIINGVSGINEFDAVSDVSLRVQVESVKQYINGAWVIKTTKVYQNGAWHEAILNLYNYGDECDSVTGGWLNYYNGGVTKNADNINITGAASGTSRYRIRTNITIDLSSYKTMYIECSHGNSGSNNNGGVIISTSNSKNTYPAEGADAVIIAPKTNATKVIYNVDIENLTGSYYVFVTSGYGASFKMYRLWVC